MTCQNNHCQYQGHYTMTAFNIPDKTGKGTVFSRKAKQDVITITIDFSPIALAQTYRISTQHQYTTVENNQHRKNSKLIYK